MIKEIRAYAFNPIDAMLSKKSFLVLCLGSFFLNPYLFAQKAEKNLANLPYIDPSIPSMETENFHQTLRKVKKDLLWGEDSSALQTLISLSPKEQLASLYQHIIAADLMKKIGQYKNSDSTLQEAQKFSQTGDWEAYILLKRYRLYLRDSSLQKEPLELLASLLKSKPEEVVRIQVLFKIIDLTYDKTKPEAFDKYLGDLLELDHINPLLDSAYDNFFSPIDLEKFSYDCLKNAAQFKTKKSKYAKARDILEFMDKKFKDKKSQKEIEWALADNYYKHGRFKNAAKAYSRYVKKYGNSSTGILQMARSYTKSGNIKKGKKYYDMFTSMYPKHRKTEEIYWVRGFEAEQDGNFSRAEEYYNKLVPTFEDGSRGSWAYFRRGFSFYKNKDLAAAEKMFKKGASIKSGGQEVAACSFWLGYVIYQKGLKDSALTIMVDTFKNNPLNFYGHQAQAFLKKEGMWKSEFMELADFKMLSEDSLKNWMAKTFSNYSEFKKEEFESKYLSIKDLLELGLDTMAMITLDAKYNSYRKNPWFSYTYAKLFYPYWPGRAYRMALNIQYQIHYTKWGEVPLNVLRQIYPRPYREYVFKNAKDKNLEENFIYALMRQESGFDEDIRSWAGAIGLMQIMPYTGKDLAKKAKLKDFKPFDLTKAAVNVFLGTNYLMDLKSDYNHNLMLVLANYNAGPGPARRWEKEHSKKEVEIFVEEVSYWETRDYIKKVMGNFWNYDLIYAEDSP